jgi:hypothetical protein
MVQQFPPRGEESAARWLGLGASVFQDDNVMVLLIGALVVRVGTRPLNKGS